MTTPELMDSLGLTKEALIKQHLRSLLSATTTKVIIGKGKAKKVSWNHLVYPKMRFMTSNVFQSAGDEVR